MFYRRKDYFESLVSCAVMSLALVQPAPAAEDSADGALDEIVGEWDLAGTDTTIEIRADHLVFHSRLGQGDIRHENVHYFTVEYRQHHLECYYQIKRYGEDELSIVVARLPADQNCDLGMMRRSPGNVKARLEQARAQAEEKAKKKNKPKKKRKRIRQGPSDSRMGWPPMEQRSHRTWRQPVNKLPSPRRFLKIVRRARTWWWFRLENSSWAHPKTSQDDLRMRSLLMSSTSQRFSQSVATRSHGMSSMPSSWRRDIVLAAIAKKPRWSMAKRISFACRRRHFGPRRCSPNRATIQWCASVGGTLTNT